MDKRLANRACLTSYQILDEMSHYRKLGCRDVKGASFERINHKLKLRSWSKWSALAVKGVHVQFAKVFLENDLTWLGLLWLWGGYSWFKCDAFIVVLPKIRSGLLWKLGC